VFNLALGRIDGGTGKIRWRAITMRMTSVLDSRSESARTRRQTFGNSAGANCGAIGWRTITVLGN